MITTSSNTFSLIYPIIHDALEKHYCHLYSVHTVKIELQQVLERPFSCTAFLAVTVLGTIHKLVSKTVVHHEINKSVTESENQAVVEYNILGSLYPNFIDIDRCSVPEPILLLPDIETYIMKFVDGIILSDLNKSLRYFTPKTDYSQLKEYYFLAGNWLKHFQKATGITSAGVESLDGVLDRCEQRLLLIQSSGDLRYPNNFRAKVMDFMQETKTKVSADRVLVCGRHGDFTPWNILAGSEGVTVIDFLGYKQEPLHVDLCKMLVYLEDETMSLTSSKKRADGLKEQFMAGYGEFPEQLSPVALLCEAMQRAVSMWGTICSKPRFIHHQWAANQRFASHLNWFKNAMRKEVP